MKLTPEQLEHLHIVAASLVERMVAGGLHSVDVGLVLAAARELNNLSAHACQAQGCPDCRAWVADEFAAERDWLEHEVGEQFSLTLVSSAEATNGQG